ncbi:hypothetical protein EUX98_g6922 [Antrodiella citrinella]|uniref:DUF6535 domain-containing protein n=1 Tax=Antrodiella citrinella TaxID=2447956 RepID=A0A4S4MQB3_9APHY|nr:hypothetical protein EUX98_g6922 [Antrodiella citrinella]
MAVRSLYSTAFAGQDLVLSQMTAPDLTIIWVQSLLYASSGASLFAALAAMMGEEWLSHYTRVGERGTIEDRCIDRQRKFIAMRGSLLLFGVAVLAFMWSQQQTTTGVIVAVNITGVLYGVLLTCSLVFPDWSYHIPLTGLTLAAKYGLQSVFSRVLRIVQQNISLSHVHFEARPDDNFINASIPSVSLPSYANELPLIPTDPTAIAFKTNAVSRLDVPCVE